MNIGLWDLGARTAAWHEGSDIDLPCMIVNLGWKLGCAIFPRESVSSGNALSRVGVKQFKQFKQ